MAWRLSLSALLLSIICTCTLPARAWTRGKPSHGFIGYGINMYRPVCATACRESFTNPLKCSVYSAQQRMIKRNDDDSLIGKPGPECFAVNEPYLLSLAYCISKHCPDEPPWKLEQWWSHREPGRAPNEPIPKYTYQEALAKATSTTPPNATTPVDEVLLKPGLVDEELWVGNYNGDYIFRINEATHVRYGLVLITTGAAIPIASSLLRFIPFPRTLVSRFEAFFINAPLGSKHRVPVLNTIIAPTRGQALFIAYLWIINIVLCSAGYESKQPSTWFSSRRLEVTTYVSYRTGILAFANLVLVMLYAGRSNVLL